MAAAMRRLRIAQVAPPVERVPPAAYGGTERVVHELTTQLVERGHDVTVFASGDSNVPGKLVPTVDRALRPAGIESDASGWFATTVKMVVEQGAEFDVIHSHLEWWSIPLARLAPVPVVATFHGRLDLPWADRLFRDAPDGMVAISRHQASTHPDVPWTIIHNGLTLDTAPFLDEPGDSFCFVGRVDAEKGITEAIDIALRAGRRLRIAAKVGNLARQRDYYENVFRPALKRAGHSVEYLGELKPAERDQLFAESYGTLMPGAWPEPFGLVSIESLACGTPVLARRVGALPEIIREGVDGFFGDDAAAMAFFADRLAGLDRREIRERVIERFSAARMTDRYEELYTRMVEAAEASTVPGERVADAEEVAEALATDLPTEVTEPEDVELPEMPVAATATFADATAVDEAEPTSEEAVAAPLEGPVTEEPVAAEAPAVEEPAAEPIAAEAAEPIAPEAAIAAEAAEPIAPEEPIAAEAVEAEEIAEPVAAEEPIAAQAAEEPAEEPRLAEPIAAEAAEESEHDEMPLAAFAAEAASLNGLEPTVPEPAEAEIEVVVEILGASAAPEEGPTDEAIAAQAHDEAPARDAPTEEESAAVADVGEEVLVEAVVVEPVVDGSTPPDEAPPEPPAVTSLIDRTPVAVGPGLNTTQPRAMPPTPGSVEAGAEPAPQPVPKPAARRPSKPIRGLFMRTWTGSGSKSATGRRRDRS
jgi:glycosyltransferase involved in cell wall biosynthesis